MSDESMWKAVHRMESAAAQIRGDADRIEEASRRIAHIFEPGYGGNGLLLLEALEEAKLKGEST